MDDLIRPEMYDELELDIEVSRESHRDDEELSIDDDRDDGGLGDSQAGGETTESEEVERTASKRRRRRRGGRRSGRSKSGAPGDGDTSQRSPTPIEDEVSDRAKSGGFDDDDASDMADDESLDDETSSSAGSEKESAADSEERPRRRRRRGGRRGGKKSTDPARAESPNVERLDSDPDDALIDRADIDDGVEGADEEVADLRSQYREDEEKPRRPARQRVERNETPTDDHAEDHADDLDDRHSDDDADDAGHDAKHAIPTWQEVIGLIVDGNMEARSRAPRGGGNGYRGRSSGGRGGRR